MKCHATVLETFRLSGMSVVKPNKKGFFFKFQNYRDSNNIDNSFIKMKTARCALNKLSKKKNRTARPMLRDPWFLRTTVITTSRINM